MPPLSSVWSIVTNWVGTYPLAIALAFIAVLLFAFLFFAIARAKRIAIGGGYVFVFEANEQKSALIRVRKK
jgi:hypothetical protein